MLETLQSSPRIAVPRGSKHCRRRWTAKHIMDEAFKLQSRLSSCWRSGFGQRSGTSHCFNDVIADWLKTPDGLSLRSARASATHTNLGPRCRATKVPQFTINVIVNARFDGRWLEQAQAADERWAQC